MKILAIITARAGSKRIPGKNTKVFGGKPLIQWTFDLVKKISKLENVLVSTDDEKVVDLAKESGLLTPWLRPSELSGDKASSIDVCLHAIDWYEKENGKIDAILLLQPTSPFREMSTVNKGISLFLENSNEPVIGVSTSKESPRWCFEKSGDFLKPLFGLEEFKKRSQDLPEYFTVNGSFYLVKVEHLKKTGSFYSEKITPLYMNSREGLDIDVPADWDLATELLGKE